MTALKSIESKLEEIFKDLPPLPDASKEALANVWPWLALIGGVVQLYAAYLLYKLANFASGIIDVASNLSVYTTGLVLAPTGFDKTVMYLGIAVLIADAIILLLAFPKLQKREKAGWDLLFLGTILYLVYAVLQIFTFQRGMGDFILGLIGSGISLYLLFQVREKFGGKKLNPGSSAPSK